MYDFIFILTAIFEILLTCLCIDRILKLEKKVIALNGTITLYANIILELNKKISNIISKINKVVSIITSKRLLMIKKTVRILIDVVQIIILIRSLNLKNGLKSLNFEAVKKIIMTETIRQLIKKLVFY